MRWEVAAQPDAMLRNLGNVPPQGDLRRSLLEAGGACEIVALQQRSRSNEGKRVGSSERVVPTDETSVDDPMWRRLAAQAVGHDDWEARLSQRTLDHIPILPLHHAGNSRLPTRPTAWRAEAAWDIRTLCDTADPVTANAAAIADLQAGATSLLVRVRPPAGPDSTHQDHGIVIMDRADAWDLLRNLVLEAAPLAFDAAHRAVSGWSIVVAAVEKGGGDPQSVRLRPGADPIGAAVRGAPFSLGPAVALAKAAAARWPAITALRADGQPWHEAGASEAQELAATLATAVAYLRALDDAGVAPAAAARQIELRLAVDAEPFAGIAKLRAMRMLWARVAAASGIDAQLDLHAQTSVRMLSAHDPVTNIVRNTIAGFAAAVGGADAITVLPHDHALGPSEPLARRIARNVQLVLMEEANLHRVADPVAGSWFAKHLSRDLAGEAWRLFQEIERAGGMIAAVRAGLPQGWAQRTAAMRAAKLGRGEDVVVGVTGYVAAAPPAPCADDADDALLAQAAEKLAAAQEWDDLDDLLAIVRAGGTPAPERGGDLVPKLVPARPVAFWERLRERVDAAARAGRRPLLALRAPDDDASGIGPAIDALARAIGFDVVPATPGNTFNGAGELVVEPGDDVTDRLAALVDALDGEGAGDAA